MKNGNRLQLLVNLIMDNYYANGNYPNRYVEDVADYIMKDFKGIPDILRDHQIETAIKYIEEDLQKED